MSERDREGVRRELLGWYGGSARDLPWRRKPEPYAVWVSEVMLQQTQVETVKGYFSRWMQRFPTVKALAAATESDVLHAWQGLGYYSRARNLWRGAQAVVERHGGAVPAVHDELLALPGVGPYSAGAILSIAHGKAAPIVDGNVVRVLCRLFGLRGDPTRAPLKNEIWALATALVPESRPGDFNQSMMELGATVCTPRSPACLTCPLMKRCAGRRQGLETTLPELPKRRATVDVARAAAVIRRGDHVLSVVVPPTASRWAGMWQFPNTDVSSGETAEGAARRAVHDAIGVRVADGERLLTVRHAVTHHRITLDVFAYAVKTKASRAGLAWKRPDELHELAMPSAHRRIAKALEDAE